MLGRTDRHNFGEDPISELELFAEADPSARAAILQTEIEREVGDIQDLTRGMDAFDVIELMRLRELPIAPVAALDPGFDGSAAAMELVTLTLLCRVDRHGARAQAAMKPHEVIDQLHTKAMRLIRLAGFRLMTDGFTDTDHPLRRLATEQQMHHLMVRQMQYESVQAAHDQALFDTPEMAATLNRSVGFDYKEYVAVRNAVQDRYTRTLTDLRDETAEIMSRTQSEGREPTRHELDAFHRSIERLMFLPGARAGFSASDVVDESGLRPERVQAVLDAFTIGFDAAKDPFWVVRDFLLGRNPLSATCLIRDDEGRYLMTAQIGSDSLRSLIEAALKPDVKRWEPYNRARARVSEALCKSALERALRTPPAFTNLSYYGPRDGVGTDALGPDCASIRDVGEATESDALFVIDDVAICVEVKARTIADAAHRGDIKRLNTEVNNIIGSGAGQAGRLASLVRENHGVWLQNGSWLDLGGVREVHSVVVALDTLGPLSVILGDLVQAGIVPSQQVPWVTSLHDLDVISAVVDRPAEFLLYLRRRTDAGVVSNYRGVDELDFYMLFQNGQLYVEPDPDAIREMHPTTPPPTNHDRKVHAEDAHPTQIATFTDPLDAWMYRVEGTNPFEAVKPTFSSDPNVAALVDFLEDGRKPGWFRFGADLLGISGRSQTKLIRTMRRMVRRSRSDGSPHSLMQSYAGPWGLPVFIAFSKPQLVPLEFASRHLREYLTAKKHQLRADRGLGILLDEDGQVIQVVYLNDIPREDSTLDQRVNAMKLQPVGVPQRPIPPSAQRPTHRLRGAGAGKKRRR